jgi:hypothetical protein
MFSSVRSNAPSLAAQGCEVVLGDTFKINGKLLLVVGAIFLAVLALVFLSVFTLVVRVSLA